MKLIGLTGKKGSGKDTAAKALIIEEGYAKVSFASSLKDLCSEVFEVPSYVFEDQAYKDEKFPTAFKIDQKDIDTFIDLLDYNFESASQVEMIEGLMFDTEIESPRQLLQYIGTDIIRYNVDPEYFTTQTKHRITEWHERGENVVVTDVRFRNEAIMIKKMGGQILEITRKDRNKEQDSHISENISIDADGIIDNNGSVEELISKIRSFK